MSSTRRQLVGGALISGLTATFIQADDWRGFRGTHGDGLADDFNRPIESSASKKSSSFTRPRDCGCVE
jgi:hypothetical protein